MAKWNGAAFVEIHGRLLDAMAPFLRTSPSATLSVLNKIFELLTSLPMSLKVSRSSMICYNIAILYDLNMILMAVTQCRELRMTLH